MERGLVSNYAEQIRGVSYKPNDIHDGLDKDSIILLRANNIDDGRINFDDVVYVDRKKVSKSQYLRKGDVLICASSGSRNLVGKAAFVDFETECTFGAFCKIVRPTKVTPEFLGLFFQSPSYRKKISALAQGANINNIKNEHIDNLQLAIYSEKEQRQIIERITRVITIIHARKQELSKLDELVKARFVEQFGNPFDTYKWDVKKLSELSESMVDGSNVDTSYYESEGEVLFLRIQNVWRNEFRLDDSVYISSGINREHYYDTSLKKGDLLITKIGRFYTKDSSLGRVSVYLGENDCANYSNNIMRVRLNNSMNSEFVNALLNLDEYQSFIKRTSKGGTDKRALSKTLIGGYPIIIPPRRLQDDFVSFVHQVDKSKVVVQKSLEETQLLFNSLMQEYFG